MTQQTGHDYESNGKHGQESVNTADLVRRMATAVRINGRRERSEDADSRCSAQDGAAARTADKRGKAAAKQRQRAHRPSEDEPTRDDGAATKSFQNPGLSAADLQDLNALQQNFGALAAGGNKFNQTGDISLYRNVRWATLGIKRDIVCILEEIGFAYPSPVQMLSIPHAIGGKDLLVRAKNGSGKSAAFILPVLNRIDTAKGLQAVIVVPGRELVLQVSKTLMAFARKLGIKSAPLVGGTNMTEDIMRLSAGVHIVVGTPGRLLDLLSRNLCSIESSVTVVFDEADKLLDSVFYSSVHDLLEFLPRKRQMLLYSATFPQSIEGFVRQNMQAPLKIKVSEQSLPNIKQYFVKVKTETKLACVKSLLTMLTFDQCIIYCNTINNVKNLAQKITEMGMSAFFIYSTMDQDERNIVYHNFANGNCKILVSTDITTRGIDAQAVNLVVNFDMSISSDSYLHRIGRAGRFGTAGCAVSLIKADDTNLLHQYENALGVSILPISDASFKQFCKK